MSVELRSVRCHHFRVTREPCMNPAVVEVLGPAPHLLCAHHAGLELTSSPGWAHVEGWERHGAEEYARYCEEAINFLDVISNKDGGVYDDNPVLAEIIEEAINYLEQYELERSRAVLLRRGGMPQETTRETDRRELWEEWSGKLKE